MGSDKMTFVQNHLETDPVFYRRLFKIAVPAILQSQITTGVNLVDNIMLGQLTTASGRTEAIRVSTGGIRYTNLLGKLEDWNQLYLCDGWWPEENVFQMHCRWLETCLEDVYTLTFEGSTVTIKAENNSPWQFEKREPVIAVVE